MFNRSFPKRSKVSYLPIFRSFSILLIASMLISPVGALAAPLAASSETSSALIAPPWCGDPIPDSAAALPDGSNPGDPAGSFPHIPWYAFACTLANIQ
ncbi:MAG TPA: hypothetical protein DEH25_13705, partial [Chloroflexi bacterium]|nr:hypothetical protein [Chloroflexota bacterium]